MHHSRSAPKQPVVADTPVSHGMTIADLVQQVFYAIYKVRLDVTYADDLPEAFHADTDKFKEVIMEANFVLQELQKEQDWHWLRDRLEVGFARPTSGGQVMEFTLPPDIYKLATGFNDAVRLRNPRNHAQFMEVPITSARSGNTHNVAMHDQFSRINVPDRRLQAFMVGSELTFTRPFAHNEIGMMIETDVIRRLEPLHICDDKCKQPCWLTYKKPVLTEIPDPLWVVYRTAAKRAEGDPSVLDRVQNLTDDAQRMLSAMKQIDSAKTVPDTYSTSDLGFVSVY